MVKLKQSHVSLLWPLQLHSTLREENLGCPLCSQRGFLLLLLLLLIEGWNLSAAASPNIYIHAECVKLRQAASLKVKSC